MKKNLLQIAKKQPMKNRRVHALSDEDVIDLIIAYINREIGHGGIKAALVTIGIEAKQPMNWLTGRILGLARAGKTQDQPRFLIRCRMSWMEV